MRMIEITVMGQKIELPEYKACEHCGKVTCRLQGYSHPKFCNECKSTEWYEKYLATKEEENKRFSGMDDALKSNKPAAVYEGRGREVVVNNKGDIIANVPAKPRPTGRKDWGKF